METCFVIQRFDGDIYDRRFRETFGPAIELGGARPVRADEILGPRPIVDKIEQGIRSASVVFAEVSEDNPNVFLELGFALSLGVPCVIACDKAKRQSLPFDIAHRPVEFYSTNSQSDYEKIAVRITKGIAAALLDARPTSSSNPSDHHELDVDDVKNACLGALLTQTLRSPVGAAFWELQKELSADGITERMLALALTSLLDQSFVDRHEVSDQDGEWISYRLSEKGQKHLLRSYSEVMKEEKSRASQSVKQALPKSAYGDLDDDIPF